MIWSAFEVLACMLHVVARRIRRIAIAFSFGVDWNPRAYPEQAAISLHWQGPRIPNLLGERLA